jgi:NAD(P)-dependent dehydrogenase (short-subunit alcohol dehydrogenase family)
MGLVGLGVRVNLLVISGASRGIGHAIASRWVAAGGGVVNLSRRPSNVHGVENLPCDLSEPGALDSLSKQIASIAREADQICLVHNASAMRRDRIDTLGEDDLRAVLELNLVSASGLNQRLIPFMQPGSSILYIGSTLAEKAVPGVASYVIAKHALAGMMRATCQDLAGRGIHTCMVCPGFTDTEQLRELIGDDSEILAAVTGLSAFDRLITPDEIADLVAFAARSPVLNGALIHANLGQRER